MTTLLFLLFLTGSYSSSETGLHSDSVGVGLATAEKVIWNKPEWPPYFITDGKGAGTGHIDQLLNLLQEETPDFIFQSYHAELIPFTSPRFQSGHTCNAASLRTPERDKSAYFTSLYLQPPVRLVFRTADWKKKWKEPQVLSFKYLLSLSDWHGGYATDRSYGESLDRIIQTYDKKKENLEGFKGSPESTTMLNMLASGKVDYILEYDEVMSYIAKNSFGKDLLTSVEIEEQRDPLVVNIACPRTDWGKKVILTLDNSLQHLAKKAEYKNLTKSWHSDAIRDRYDKNFEAFYTRRALPWTTASQK